MLFAALRMSAHGRFCCKSLFALVIKISFGCTREFRVKMWGTSSPEDKLAGDLGNVIEATSTGGRRSGFFTAEKLAPGNLGLLQQYRHQAAVKPCAMSAAGVSGQMVKPRRVRLPAPVRNRSEFESIVA
jgi:hypothetical protein